MNTTVRPGTRGPTEEDHDGRLWHVTVTVAGPARPHEEVRDAMTALNAARPFLHGMTVSEERAEFRFWEEADVLVDAASLAMRAWDENREAVGLPEWGVVGFEVIQRPFHLRRDGWGEHVSPGLRPLF